MDREIFKKNEFCIEINISFTKVRIRPHERAMNIRVLKKLEVKNVAVFWRHF